MPAAIVQRWIVVDVKLSRRSSVEIEIDQDGISLGISDVGLRDRVLAAFRAVDLPEDEGVGIWQLEPMVRVFNFALDLSVSRNLKL